MFEIEKCFSELKSNYGSWTKNGPLEKNISPKTANVKLIFNLSTRLDGENVGIPKLIKS